MRFLINYILIFLFVLIILPGCEEEEGLPRTKIAQMYVDILVAEQTYQYNLDSLHIAVDDVYEEHGLSKELYEGEVNRLGADEEKWKEFFELAQSYLDTLKVNGSEADKRSRSNTNPF